jgi:Uma2 family endonuclease
MSVAAETIRPDAQTQPPVHTEEIPPRHRWTVAEYFKMGEAGLLMEDDWVELIDGEVIDMSPIGSPHAGQVNHLGALLSYHLFGKAVVASQNPVILGDHNVPQPDIAVLRWRDDYYKTAHPRPQDVLLVIEVSDTTVHYDREIKVPLYARHGIPEVWLLDLQERVLEIYRNPEQGKYQHIEHLRSGRVAPLHLPEAVIQLADLFPGS